MAMKDVCKQIDKLLPDLAEGKSLPDVRAHVDSCADCAMKLEQLKTIMKAAATPIVNAAPDLVGSAKVLRSAHRKVITAKLFGSSLTLAHARTTAAEFQLVVGTEDHKVRLMYSRVGTKWEVTGRVPNKNWKVSRAKRVDAQGGFVFQADSLDHTGFSLTLEEQEIKIPSAQELLDGNSA